MRQPIELTGSGASLEDVAAALGVTPERQAAIREILSSRLQGKAVRNRRGNKLSMSKKKAAPGRK